MHSASLKGMAIVSITEGTRLGRVDDLWIDIATRTVAALQCSDQGKRFIVPFQLVRNVGKDAITVENSQVTQVDGQNGLTPGTVRLDDFLKLKVVDESGAFIGNVNQVDVDVLNGQLLSINAHKGGVLGLGGTTTAIPAEQIHAIGQELVTVSINDTLADKPAGATT